MSTIASRPVLTDLVWNTEGSQLWTKRFVLFVAGIVALWVAAKVQIATVPVPVTLQMLVVMVIGAAYGPRLGFATVAGYLALGAQGLPVFAGTPETGIGLAYMMGPTGGYLIGFALAAFVVGALGAALGWENWYAYGVKTFIWVDALKLVVAVIAFPAIWKLVGDARS